MVRLTVLTSTIIIFLLCLNNPNLDTKKTISLRLYLKPPARTNTRATKYSKIVTIFHCKTIYSDTTEIQYPNTSIEIKYDNIVSDDSSYVQIYAVNDNGIITHYGSSNISAYIKQDIFIIPILMQPICGSIILQFTNMPDSTDSIQVNIKSDSISDEKKFKYSAFDIISFDYIPDSTFAKITICGKKTTNDTVFFDTISLLYTVSQPAVFFLDGNGITLITDITINNPNNTFIGIIPKKLTKETGKLLITEIFYNSNGDSDFVEIYNTGEDTIFSFEMGIISNSSITVKQFQNIVIRKNSFYVIGDSNCPATWCDTNITIDLPTTNRWIYIHSLADSTMYDIVPYSGKDENWPQSVKNKSIVLDTTKYDKLLNNFGENWQLCTNMIFDTTDTIFVSPKKK